MQQKFVKLFLVSPPFAKRSREREDGKGAADSCVYYEKRSMCIQRRKEEGEKRETGSARKCLGLFIHTLQYV